MQWELLAGLCQIQVKLIGKQLSGFWGTCEALQRSVFTSNGELKVQGYVDADFAGEVDHQRSNTTYFFTIGTTTISWISRIQKIIAL